MGNLAAFRLFAGVRTMKRAAIYARVSTDEQAEKGYSLQSQVEACKKYAELHGLQVIETIQDDYSGTMLNRPGLEELHEKIAQRIIDAVVVYASDRWTRNLAHSLILREELLLAGIELHYVNRGKSEDAPEARMTENIEGVFNEYWREKIIESCKRGKNTKAKANKPVMSGHPPYGYRREGKGDSAKLLIDENEAYVVKQIFSWYLQGDSESGPLSLRAIAAKLDETGAPTPHFRKNTTKNWIPVTVMGILQNEIYTGRTYYRKSKIVTKKRIKQPKENWILIDCPELTIINPAIFKQVQERAKRNKERARRNQKHEYLMTGHFRCGACGYAMRGGALRTDQSTRFNYKCGNHWQSIRGDNCRYAAKSISTRKVDAAVWDWVRNLLSDEKPLREGIRAMRERAEEDLQPKQKRFDQISGMVNSRKTDLNRLIVELAQEELSVIRDAVKERVRTMGKEIEALEREAEELSKELIKR